MEESFPLLEGERAAALASLLAIGCRSGDTLAGLSALRRGGDVAYVFADRGLGASTLRELAGLARRGAQIFLLEDLPALTRAFGREDLKIVGVRRGHLALGIARKLDKGDRT